MPFGVLYSGLKNQIIRSATSSLAVLLVLQEPYQPPSYWPLDPGVVLSMNQFFRNTNLGSVLEDVAVLLKNHKLRTELRLRMRNRSRPLFPRWKFHSRTETRQQMVLSSRLQGCEGGFLSLHEQQDMRNAREELIWL